jgi:hypothetical protein
LPEMQQAHGAPSRAPGRCGRQCLLGLHGLSGLQRHPADRDLTRQVNGPWLAPSTRRPQNFERLLDHIDGPVVPRDGTPNTARLLQKRWTHRPASVAAPGVFCCPTPWGLTVPNGASASPTTWRSHHATSTSACLQHAQTHVHHRSPAAVGLPPRRQPHGSPRHVQNRTCQSEFFRWKAMARHAFDQALASGR